MASKRTATTELNHDNWNEENEPEDAGTFTKASDEVLQKRVIKAARRRLNPRDEASKSAFGGFTGFKTATTTSSSSPFSFLASSSNTFQSISSSTSNTNNESNKNSENGTSKTENAQQVKPPLPEKDKDQPEQENEKVSKKSSEYFSQLKGLNESVAQWIKTHVDKNPFCILTPIFNDYANYLNEIELKYGNEPKKSKQDEQTSSEMDSTSKNDSKDNSNKKENDNTAEGTSKKSFSGLSDWKPEKSIFGNVRINAKSIFGNTDQTSETPKSIFNNTEQLTNVQKPIFGNVETKTSSKSIFDKSSPEKNLLLNKPTASSEVKDNNESKSDKIGSGFTFTSSNSATFSFGQNSTTTSPSAGFSFGNTKPFFFGAQVAKPQDNENQSENQSKDDDPEEPPKPDFKPVTEEGAIFEQRCKVFIKKDGSFSDRGIGTLFLKPTPNGKTQLIVRAENSLGNLLLNTLLTESIPTQRMNKNTIMLVCLPDSQPPPTPVLLRVKTSEEADVLLETLDKHKK
ncbi:nuclear pore complex protein Nup50 [Polistes fuscatus]|uniref:nuclear pore complex protein Nup50 n=1 Tax=Polistes fuscatus TaxID=30207 RepID=UPI001CA885DB|nr:nuclear pore complex protein Nup50 [Polistes fuscatus]XP_043491608.1 nuclear pore complex protein Nup50 [Polistes fuscatus]